MAATYIPTGYRHSNIVVPSPGDWATAASVNTAGLKFLLDNDQWTWDYLGLFWDGININVPTGNITAQTGDLNISQGAVNVFLGPIRAIGGNVEVQSGNVEVVSGNVNVGGAINCTGSISGGAGYFSSVQCSDIYASNSLILSGNATVIGNESINGNVSVGGNATIGGNLTVSGPVSDPGGTLEVNSNLTLNGTSQLFGNSTISGNLEITGQGRIPFRYLELGDGNYTFEGSDYNFIWGGSGSSTTNYTWTITSTNARYGDWFFVCNATNPAYSGEIFLIVGGGYNLSLLPGESALYVYVGYWRYMRMRVQ